MKLLVKIAAIIGAAVAAIGTTGLMNQLCQNIC